MPLRNFLQYLDWAGNKSFEDLPFNEVDNVLFSQIVYLPLEPAVPRNASVSLLDAAVAIDDVEGEKAYEIFLRKRLQVLREMAARPRYEGLKISAFVDEVSGEDQLQFCAMTFTLPDGLCVLCFRGTDTTLVGWKEDFNMSFESPVPAQKAALEYLLSAAAQSAAPLILLGHSKGGNLAVYAAAHAPEAVQQRIRAVYSNDGPGLMRGDAQSDGYARVHDRIINLMPQGTLVGVLLHCHRPYRVVKSRALGLLQHDVFSWEVAEESPHFKYLDELSRASRIMQESLAQWIEEQSPQERQIFSDSIFEVLTAASDRTLGDLVHTDLNRLKKILAAAKGLDPKVRADLLRVMGRLLTGTMEVIAHEVKQAVLGLLPGEKEEEKPGKA